ncbi:high affinity immunoglobulin epsilon receptor subunit alpha [Petaurus breviceps papuanus]|uniref:high affinity immunoglobulin epsilon receptor subunit alpha n=1 Tax=Petaurus breviceps papuanus TaxID=3040969 RepID=UPI0036DEF0A2
MRSDIKSTILPLFSYILLGYSSLLSFHSLQATEVVHVPMEGFSPKLLWVTLLLWALSGRSTEDASKALLSLNPPWTRILRTDNVTLHCEGSDTSHSNQTQWFHNGSSTPVQTSSFSITFATINDSGEYRCQTKDSVISDPVYLGVYSDWLLLQPSLMIIREGEPLLLSCHGWKNRTVYKVTFYHNKKALKYWYENHNFFIPNTTRNNRGFYHCTGILWRIHYTSKPLYIGFKGPISYMQFLVPLMAGLLFVVDTALFVLTQKQLHVLIEKDRKLASKIDSLAKADTEVESKTQCDDEAVLDPEPEFEPEPEYVSDPDPEPGLMPLSVISDVTA